MTRARDAQNQNPYLLELKNLALEVLKDEKIKIILFGSRAGKASHTRSDVDIGLIPIGKVDEKRITELRERIEDLNIPYKVEVVNFSDVSDNFRREAMKEVIVWKG